MINKKLFDNSLTITPLMKKLKPLLLKGLIFYCAVTLGITLDFKTTYFDAQSKEPEDTSDLRCNLTVDTRRFYPSIPFVLWVAHDRSPYNLEMRISTRDLDAQKVTIDKIVILSEGSSKEKIINQTYQLEKKGAVFSQGDIANRTYSPGNIVDINFPKILKKTESAKISVFYTLHSENMNSQRMVFEWVKGSHSKRTISTGMMHLLRGLGAAFAA